MEASREFSRSPRRLPPCSDLSVLQKTRMSHFWDTHHTIIGSEYNPPSPTDSSIRAQEERHLAVIRVLNGRQYVLKSTLDFNAPTGAVQAVPRRLCKRTSERPF